MGGVDEESDQARVAGDEGQRLGGAFHVQRDRDGADAHRAEEGFDVLRAVEGEDAYAVAAAKAAGGEAGGYGGAVGI